MSDWMNWLVMAGVVVIMELFTGTFYLLMIAIGLGAGALAALAGAAPVAQLITAALVGSIATMSLRRSRFGNRNRVDATRDPNVNLDIGQTLQVNDWQGNAGGKYTARARHRGARWDVEYAGGDAPLPGTFRIMEIRGSQLIVEPAVN